MTAANDSRAPRTVEIDILRLYKQMMLAMKTEKDQNPG